MVSIDRAPDDFANFYAYCVRDIIAEDEASARLPDLSPRELKIWQVDQRINKRGMQIDTVGVGNCIRIVEQASEKYNAELRDLTRGAVQSSNKVADTLRWFQNFGIYMDALDEDAVYEALTHKEYPPAVLRALSIRKLLAFGSVKKLYAMRSQTARDGRLRDQYAYHAAHTSLWNGHNVQMANLYSGKLKKPWQVDAALGAIASGRLAYVEACFGDAMETVADCLRSMVIAAPGHDLISADYSAIQAVVLACLAGEQWQIDIFKGNGKFYEAFAAGLTGKPLQFYLDYRKQHGEHHPDRQTYGKIAGLSTGFGAWIGGWKRFGAEVFGDDAEIKRLILKAWDAIPATREFWGGQTRDKFRRSCRAEMFGLEGCALAAMQNPGACYGYRGVRYQVHGDTLYCQPPTDGAPLQYHEPRYIRSTRQYAEPWEYEMSYMGWNSNPKKGQAGWQRMKLYGGLQTQNVVAKVAREFQANALVALDDMGVYLPVMHTHDENVIEIGMNEGNIVDYMEIVNRCPPWAYLSDGAPWPVKAPDAWRGPRYGKWE